MKQSKIYNLSGRAIPDNAEITITGDPKSAAALIIESFDGTSGIAHWRTAEELKARLEQLKAKDSRPAWAPPLKSGAPYS